MARIRTIKPDFFTSEDVVSLSPLARLLYVATWLEADREGRFVWRPKTLKLRYLPGDQCDIEILADELVTAGLVVPYTIDGQTFAEIPTFAKHQVINNRESASTIQARVINASGTRDQRVTDATTTPLMGKERKVNHRHRLRRLPTLRSMIERRQSSSRPSSLNARAKAKKPYLTTIPFLIGRRRRAFLTTSCVWRGWSFATDTRTRRSGIETGGRFSAMQSETTGTASGSANKTGRCR